MAEEKESCVKPAKGIISAVDKLAESKSPDGQAAKEGVKMIAKVGKPAPDFELSALVGKEFKNIRLSDYKGKWIVLCFYPGDFTFV